MGEQEFYKRMLKKIIDDTEKNRISSQEEMVQTLINELSEQLDKRKSRPVTN
ncbi:hypothetical protein [Ornithinibacillus halophilus]|uniref:Uncharacterized protein n=1 Tax=Ornithinibacillus halophilus TaxID=930117 RepID=A0A1M5FD65_9BACI|nr:hypothetical protein [Ornithinibacillus halophilus]SHF89510.1 hypothetical protein SAMN05216225_100838 [Ornithinibacillus halophilus]